MRYRDTSDSRQRSKLHPVRTGDEGGLSSKRGESESLNYDVKVVIIIESKGIVTCCSILRHIYELLWTRVIYIDLLSLSINEILRRNHRTGAKDNNLTGKQQGSAQDTASKLETIQQMSSSYRFIFSVSSNLTNPQPN